MHLSRVDHSTTPPRVEIPRDYNAAHDLLARNAARPDKVAYIDAATGQQLTYGQLADQAHRFASALRQRGIAPETRVMVAMLDTLEWPVVFLGSILAGVVPIAANTLLTTKDFDFMLRDSRAQVLFVSRPLMPTFEPLIGRISTLQQMVVAGDTGDNSVAHMIASGTPDAQVAGTCSDDACFWLYSSGSTGTPKGTVHLHSHLVQTAELYARPILGIREDDVVYSAAKLFFAYGLGNALTFPMSVGATTVLLPGRPMPADVFGVLKKYRPTIFYGVPTLYAALLADANRPQKSELNLRVCTSAGEAMPADIGERWTRDYNEVKAYGAKVSTMRSPEQSEIARFWEYSLPGIYHGVVRSVASVPGRDIVQNARLFAAVAQAMDDAMIGVFDAKYHYHFWRPVTAIRNGDIDGNPATERDAGWTAFHDAPMHPEYPSGHAILAGALGAVLKTDLGDARVPVLSTSSPSARNAVRRWTSIDAFVNEVADARIYEGIHFRSAVEIGVDMGQRIGRLAADRFLAQ